MTSEPLKIRVYREDLLRVMSKLQDELNKHFLYKPLTPAVKEHMKYMIASYMRNMGQGERNPVWQVKIEIQQDPNSISSFTLNPVLDNVTLLNRNPLTPPDEE